MLLSGPVQIMARVGAQVFVLGVGLWLVSGCDGENRAVISEPSDAHAEDASAARDAGKPVARDAGMDAGMRDASAPDAGETDDGGDDEGGDDEDELDAAPLPDLDASPPKDFDAGPALPANPHLFGSHGGYASGVTFPSASEDERDQATAKFYEIWKSNYLVPACKPGEYRVATDTGNGTFTVSEGHGYGMVIVAVMAGYDVDAHELYDGLFSYYLGHPTELHRNLMSWAQNADCHDVEGYDSATDGDLDIAYSLLLADRQWGSQGAIDYRKQALRIMANILDGDVSKQNTILVGDWTDVGDHDTGTRTSDFMPGHFRSFAKHTNEPRWTQVVDKLYALVAQLQQNHAPYTGLLPDFAEQATTNAPIPAPADWLESDTDGEFSWNACRDPWRLSVDYLLNGEPRSRDAMRKLNSWIRWAVHDDPTLVQEGYSLSGLGLGGEMPMAFIGPFGVAAMINPEHGTNRAWVDNIWNLMTSADNEDYYGDSIRLMSMIVMSGNWWQP
jgi:endo-1,4-beta-D-glucanase Y